MSDPIVTPIAQVEREAAAAARQFTDVNEACPYPFHSEAGRLFRAAFLQARNALLWERTAP
jgi:hypothetical protein